MKNSVNVLHLPAYFFLGLTNKQKSIECYLDHLVPERVHNVNAEGIGVDGIVLQEKQGMLDKTSVSMNVTSTYIDWEV